MQISTHKFFLFIFIILISTFSVKSQNSVSTLCGSSNQGAPFSGPNGICISPDGATIYSVDYSSHRIFSINVATGIATPFAGSITPGYIDGPLASSRFYFPAGIKISSDGLNLYVTDNANCVIRKIDLVNSSVSTVAGVYNAYDYADSSNALFAKFNQPVDLVIAPGDSIIYISDSENHLIRKLNLNSSSVSTVAGIPGSLGLINGPSLSSRFRNPNGLAISSDGTKLYIADAGNHCIRKVDFNTGMVNTVAGTGVAGNINAASGLQASFDIPQGICLLPNNSLLYVMDTFNNLIRLINVSTTAVSTIAGSTSTPSSHFANNINGLLAKFYHPVNGVLSNDMQKLYISDQENFRIRIMNTDNILIGIPELSSTKPLHIYPNPAKSTSSIYLKINLTGDIDVRSYSILTKENNSYKIRNTSTENEFLLPGNLFHPGINIIKISNHSNIYYDKIIID